MVRTPRSAPSGSATPIFESADAGSGGLLLCVKAFDFGAVLFRDPLALDLHTGGELVADDEVGVEDFPLLDLFRMREPSIDVGDCLLDQPAGTRVSDPAACLASITIEGDQGRDKRTAVTEHDRLADASVAAELGLHRPRRHVLSARGLEQVLLAIGDLQVAVLVELADIAGLEPAIHQVLVSRPGILVVTGKDIAAFHQDLPIVRDPNLDTRKRQPNGSEAPGGRRGTTASGPGATLVCPFHRLPSASRPPAAPNPGSSGAAREPGPSCRGSRRRSSPTIAAPT